MVKKFLVMVAVLLTLCLCATALASEATPSKTTGDMNTVVEAVTEVPNPEFVLFVQEVASERATAKIEEIYQFVVVQSQPPARFFEEEVQEKIVELLPDGVAIDNLELNEFVPLDMINFTEAQGKTVVALQFATEYQDGQVVVPVLIIFGEDGEMTAIPLEAVVEDGVVKVTFPVEVLAMMESHEFALAVLSNPLE